MHSEADNNLYCGCRCLHNIYYLGVEKLWVQREEVGFAEKVNLCAIHSSNVGSVNVVTQLK